MSKFRLLIYSLAVTLTLFAASKGDVYGPVTRDQILQNQPQWKSSAAAYTPDWEAVEFLKSVEIPLHLQVYMGLWCPDCAQHVSQLFKILEVTENPMISVSYISLPKDPSQRSPHLNGRDIHRLPTFIFLASGEEIGRIIEHPEISLEEDLSDLLRAGDDTELDYDFFMSNYHADMDVDCTACHLD